MAYHPAVAEYLAQSERLSDALRAAQAAMFDDLRVRRAAPSEPDVMPEIDGYGALTNLFLGEGVADRYRPAELEALVMDGLRECYAVWEERREEAARAAVPGWAELEKWFGPSAQQAAEAPASESDDADGSAP